MKSLSALFVFCFESDWDSVRPEKKVEALHHLLHKYLGIASWLNVEIHLLIYMEAGEETINSFEKRRLERGGYEIYRMIQEELGLIYRWETAKPTILHLISGGREDLFKLIDEILPNFICFEDGDIAEDASGENIKQALLKRVSIPFLILPRRMPEEVLPFQSLIVPISGEQRPSEALFQSLALAETVDAYVTLIHVREPNISQDVCGIECMSDQIQHEYLYQLDKIVSEGSPRSTLRERRRVTHIAHLSGTTSECISGFMKGMPKSILVLEWKGVLVQGRAEILKGLLRRMGTPILVVKMIPQVESSLKIGEKFREAG